MAVVAAGAVLALLAGAGSASSAARGSAAPAIASVSPGAAVAGAKIAIHGSGLDGATEVDFDGSPAAIVSDAATKIVAQVPPDAGVGPVSVTTGGGTAASPHDFKPAPRLVSSDPEPAQAGDALTLTGTNLGDASALRLGSESIDLGGGDATELDTDSLPDDAATGSLRVTTPGGTSAPLTLHVRPTIDDLSDSEGTVGTTVTISGNTFTGTRRVTFGSPGAAASFHVVDRTTLTAKVPVNAVSGPITVTNAGGSTDSDDDFGVLPTLSSFSPGAGAAGTTIAIAGSGLADTNEVSVGGVDVASFRIVSGSQLLAVVAPGTVSGPVEVTNAADVADSAKDWVEKPFVLRGTIDIGADSIDPALAYTPKSWELERLTCRTLLTHPTADPVGLAPDAAAALPTVSSDGLTYTFTIRPDVRFAPPWDEAITAQTFRFSLERALSPDLASPGQAYLGDVKGARAFMAGDADSISGLVADGDTLEITLVRPLPDFVQRIALPFFCAVPENTPPGERTVPLPPAGPYRITRYAEDGIVLKRNPDYAGPVEANADRIQLLPNGGSASSRDLLLSGQIDFAAEGLSGADWTAAAKLKPAQAHVSPQAAFFYLALNTSGDVLSSPEARQAVNLALNRKQLAALLGPGSGSPTDQYLTPAMPGFRDAKIYPLNGPSAADLRRANRLIDEAGVRGDTAVLYTCLSPSCQALAQSVQKSLAKIGLDLDVESFSDVFGQAGHEGAPFDLALVGWKADYSDPSAVLNVLLDGSTIRDDGNTNLSYLDDPGVNGSLAAAAGLSGADRLAAYGNLDVRLATDIAPLAAISTIDRHDFLSSRVGCVRYDGNGVALGALCLK